MFWGIAGCSAQPCVQQVVQRRTGAKTQFRRPQVDTVDVQIVSVLHLGTVQFATTHEKVDQAIAVRKLRLMHGGNQVFRTGHR